MDVVRFVCVLFGRRRSNDTDDTNPVFASHRSRCNYLNNVTNRTEFAGIAGRLECQDTEEDGVCFLISDSCRFNSRPIGIRTQSRCQRVSMFFVRSNNDVLWWQIRDGDSHAITARTHKPQNTHTNTIHTYVPYKSLVGGDERINSPHHHNNINATRAHARNVLK